MSTFISNMENVEHWKLYMTLIDGKFLISRGSPKILNFDSNSIAAVPSYAGLRHFHEGRDYAQWTGDDSKALMKVVFEITINFLC